MCWVVSKNIVAVRIPASTLNKLPGLTQNVHHFNEYSITTAFSCEEIARVVSIFWYTTNKLTSTYIATNLHRMSTKKYHQKVHRMCITLVWVPSPVFSLLRCPNLVDIQSSVAQNQCGSHGTNAHLWLWNQHLATFIQASPNFTACCCV